MMCKDKYPISNQGKICIQKERMMFISTISSFIRQFHASTIMLAVAPHVTKVVIIILIFGAFQQR